MSFVIIQLLHFLFQTAYLSRCGGSKDSEVVRRMLNKMMTTDVAKLLNWMGKNSNKQTFSKLALKDVIIGTCLLIFSLVNFFMFT